MYQTTPWPAVRPSSASSTILPLLQRPNDSASGAFEVLPSSFMRLNAGVSLRLRRIQTDTISSSNDSRNGIRHPQPLLKVSSPRKDLVAMMTISDRKRPSVAVVWIHEV